MTENLQPKPARIQAPDALRGLIIGLMALDHANHFIAQKHSSGEYWGGPFPAYQEAFPFLTRLVTHLSAPGFFFLMGMGMILFAESRRRRGWPEVKIIGHFVLRGLLLIALQLFVVNRAWELSPGGWELETYIGVLFALGGTMILGSLFYWLGSTYLLALTAVFLFSDAYLPPDPNLWRETFSTLSRLISIPGGDLSLWVNYPILPWMPLVTLGMLFGYWLSADKKKTFQRALWIGAAFLTTFFALRFLDGFGNIRPRAGDGWIAFFNMVKYPPSLTFTLLTMGINLLVLWGFSKIEESYSRYIQPLIVFGRAPLFFYVTHLFLYTGLGLWLTPTGTSIPAMFPYWILGLLILYPLCLWYGRFKGRQSEKSLIHFL